MIHRLLFAYLLYPLSERYTGRDIRSKLSALERHFALPFKERRIIAAKRLVATLRHAGEHVPYYRELFADVDFDPSRVERDPDHLQRLPYLTKEIVRSEGKRLLNDNIFDGRFHKRKTGGSTGPAALIYYSQEAMDWTAAAHLLVVRWTGKRKHWQEAHLATRPAQGIPWRDSVKEFVKCCAMNRINIYTDSFDERELDEIWQQINKTHPYLIQGHPSTLYALARHVAAAGYKVDTPVTVFESTGELLDAKRRTFIEEVLHCRTINRYGNAEFGVVAYERTPADRDWLQVLDFMVWPETYVYEDGSSELVGTSLTNMAMPLIRYRTGDLAELVEKEDAWYLTNLMGRVHEMVTIHGKTYPTHYIQDVLDRIPGIADFQLVEREGKVPLMRLVPEADFSTQDVAEKILEYWGDHVELMFVNQSALEHRGRRAKFFRVIREAPLPDSAAS